MNRTYYRGDMYFTDFGIGLGSEQMGYRPAVIIQNNTGEQMLCSPACCIALFAASLSVLHPNPIVGQMASHGLSMYAPGFVKRLAHLRP